MSANSSKGNTYDTIIRHGVVVDGTGAPAYKADVGIRDGRIAAIGSLKAATADKSFDAEGRYVTPGFVDCHTHYDVQIFRDPTCADALQNGITTVAMGNCGIGLAPCKPSDRESYMMSLEAVEQIPLAVQKGSISAWTWESIPEFIEAVKRTPKGINVMMYAPMGSIMNYVMGLKGAKLGSATDEEFARMHEIVSEAMDAGAMGVSLTYLKDRDLHFDPDGSPLPTNTVDDDFVCRFASILAQRGDGVIQALSGIPCNHDTVSVTEALLEQVGRPVLHNLLTLQAGKPEQIEEQLAWHNNLLNQGKPLFSQAFNGRQWIENRLGEAVTLDVDATFREIGRQPTEEARIKLLSDPEYQKKLRENYDPEIFRQQGSSVDWSKGVIVSAGDSAKYADCVGLTFAEAAEKNCMSDIDFFIDFGIDSGAKFVFRSQAVVTEDEIDQLARLFRERNVIPAGSDGGAHLKAFSGSGWSTDLVNWLVADKKLITIEEAHYRMSFMPARAIGLHDRGVLMEGMAADVLVYSLDELYFDTFSYEDIHDLPNNDWRKHVKAGGYHWIFVNGEVVFTDDKYTDVASGQFLPPSSYYQINHSQRQVA